MKGVIMAGGFGTRLKPLTIHRPKPMVPVANRPIMERIVDLLRRHGITDLVSILYFQPEHITSYFGEGKAFGVSMTYVTADADYGTAGAVRNAGDLIAGERVLVISGDVLTDFDLAAAVAFHEERGAEATIALTRVENPLAFGIVITDHESGRIERFLEKPTWGEVFSDTINTGIYILEPGALERVPLESNVDFSRDLFPQMLREGAALYGYIAEGYWRDVGNLEEYRRAHEDVLHGRVELDPHGERRTSEAGTLWVEEGGDVGPEVAVGGTVIVGPGARVGRGAVLENAVLGAGCEIGAGATVRNSVLWNRVRIGPGGRMSESVCASEVGIGKGALIRENCVISERAEIGAYAVVGPNVKVWPDKVVDERAVLTQSLIWGDAWERSLFHGARVSGVPNTELTPEIAARLGAAYGATLGEGGYLVSSRDSDRASRMISRAIITGFLSVGVNVEDLQVMPIPVVRHTANNSREMGGMHVRRSPFDPKVVDVLFFDSNGRDLSPSKTQSIERLFAREDFPRATPDGTGDLNYPTRVVEGYATHFLEEVDREGIAAREFSIVVDFAFGTTVEVLPRLLGTLGVRTVSLDAYPAPGRLARNERGFAAELDRLGGIVRSTDADFGLWIDPGGEVIHLVDDSGRALSPELLQVIVVGLALEQLDVRRVAVPVTSPAVVAELIRSHGAELLWTKTEHHAMMASAMGADLVAGVRGEFIFSRFLSAYDGMFAAAKVLEALARAGTRVGEEADRYPRIHVCQARIACPWGRKGTVMRELIEETEGERRDLVDGVKVWLSEGEWVLVIPHSHKPYFVITAEAGDPERAEALLADYSQRVEDWRDHA